MKILDRYIFSTFISNFVSSFIILMFIFIFQTIWLFIDDLAGKGLDIVIIGKFLFYLTPNLTEKVLPLTVLLSSILTFGNFAENYEFAAMKASGISLQKAMRSLIVFISFLAVGTFFFANNVIPASEQKIYNLRKNIGKVKPAAIISEGVFSDIEGTGMNMKVDRKYGEKDRFLENVVIHKKNNKSINNTVIKAKTGELISSEASDILQLVLKDGHYYEEIIPKANKDSKKQPFAKSNFEIYTINMDLSKADKVDLNAESNVSTDKMKNVSRLTKDIDSLKENNLKIVSSFSKSISGRMGAFIPITSNKKINNKLKLNNNLKLKTILKDTIITNIEIDTIAKSIVNIVSIDSIISKFNSSQRVQLINAAKNSTSNILRSVQAKKDELQKRYKIYNLHILSLHKKYALALACVILFFVGAPLGAIIRKGGLGLPMVIAIILFLVYYFIGVFAGNYAKEGNIHPILGAWLSTLIMMPLGIFLTKRATNDKGLINFGGIIVDFFKKLFKKKTETYEA